jgi:single-stranded-DNA-specific exonuclease
MPSGREARGKLEQELAREHGFPPLLARLFAARWQADPSLSGPYLSPRTEEMKGLKAASALPTILEHVRRARAENLPVLFYGDYDVDGILAVCILLMTSHRLGLKSGYFLPSRFNEGYGLNRRVVEHIPEKGYGLLFALDCGTSNTEEVSLAQELGITVVALDHHAPMGDAPDIPLINPHLQEGLDPMCTAGLAYCFAREWLAAEGEDPALADGFLDFAALGTVGDVVPLVGDNFILAHNGMLRMPRTKHAGLRAMLLALQLGAMEFLTWRDLAFRLVPTLNAAGRMAHPRLAAELFLAADERTAVDLAAQLISLNWERRDLQERIYEEAAQQALAHEGAAVLVLYKPEWNQGITGIVAAKIAEAFGRPAVVLSDLETGEGLSVGSGRAPAGVDLLATLEPARAIAANLGGHAAAAGLTVPQAGIPQLQELLHDAEVVPLAGAKPERPFECEAEPHELGDELVPAMMRLYPFGEGHPPPRIRLRNARITGARLVGQDKTHLMLAIEKGAAVPPLRVIGFRKSHLLARLGVGTLCGLDVELDLDNYQNRVGLQLGLSGIADESPASGPHRYNS